MKKIGVLLLLMNCFLVHGQNEQLFDEATTAYNAGEYEKAADNYLKILHNGQHSSELYFNLGNTYYKLNQIAPSIYYYEKALLLKPNDAEITNNLGYAQKMTLDAIEEVPETGLAKIKKSVMEILSFDQWSRLGVVFMILFVLLYIAFYNFQYASRKRIAFIASIVSLFVSIVAVLFAILEYNEFNSDRPAIVFSNEVVLYSEPNDRGQEVFKLHEGAKVMILDSLNDYQKIRIADGKTGWIPKESIKVLKDF